MSNLPRMLTINETAKESGLSANFIRQLCVNNRIVFVKAGTKYLINFTKFVEYLNTGDAAIAEQDTRRGVMRRIG